MTRLKFLALILVGLAALSQASTLDEIRPPKGQKVAIVVFEDLECPKCAHDHPLLMQAGKTYGVPVIIHDFPLPAKTPPFHAWSMDAALAARYFESKSPDLGHEFREYIFRSQPTIGNNPQTFQSLARQFAAEHHMEYPFALDPDGKLTAEIQKDKELGQRLGITGTPTIYIATDQPSVQPALVADTNQLSQLVEAAKKATANEPAQKSAAKSPARSTARKKPGS